MKFKLRACGCGNEPADFGRELPPAPAGRGPSFSGDTIVGAGNYCVYLRDQLPPSCDQVSHLGKLTAEMERPRLFDDITICNSRPFMLAQMLKP